VGSAPGGGTNITFPTNASHSVRVWAVTYNGDRSVEGQSESLSGIVTWGRPGTPTTGDTTSHDHYRVRLQIYAGSENGKDVTGVQYSEDGGASWHNLRSGEAYQPEVPEGGTQRSILARTVSAADGDRKYSEAVTLRATSKEKLFSIELRDYNQFNDTWAIRVTGAGFVRENRPATTTLNGLGLHNPDRCNGFGGNVHTQTVNGRFDYYVGGIGCRVSGSGSATVTTSGETRSAP